jgi:hypothetical protein
MKLALAVGLLLVAPVGGNGQAPPAAANDNLHEAVVILRVVNTVQAQLSRLAGTYGSLAQVLAAPMFKEQFSSPSRIDSATAAIGKRTLVLVASEDQKHYQAMVTPTDKCAVIVFTNETGLIYSGRALGCEQP